VEFQQWIGKRIPREEEDDYTKPLSENYNTIKWRRWKERKDAEKKSKEDYDNIIKSMKRKQ
jgi:hypothetical protein